MQIQKVISYKGAWEQAVALHEQELKEIAEAFGEYCSSFNSAKKLNMQAQDITGKKHLTQEVGLYLTDSRYP
ncbi:hypothetical protein [Comamonas terrigena]|uniref:hypothetical protein n=1 Tax=Comamonas terrigena TaxID=32013 RepID=UPI0023548223|nr:hypothetical protein [Comamonas terrigena]